MPSTIDGTFYKKFQQLNRTYDAVNTKKVWVYNGQAALS